MIPLPSFTVHGSHELRASYRACHRIVTRSNSTFALSFRLLPQDQRLGLDALYAWLRTTDDIADAPGDAAIKKTALQEWRGQSFQGPHSSLILPAFRETILRFHIPIRYFHDLLDGVESDLNQPIFGSLEALEGYCYRVAGTVGLACCAIWGVTDPAAAKPAEAAGTAFQLTNILRDIGEDRRLGRCYLPLDDLNLTGCPPDLWNADRKAFRSLIRFEANRAWTYYRRSDALIPMIPKPGRRMFLTMRGIYEALLMEIERHPDAVLRRRIRVNPARKLLILGRSLA
jgi:phytoene synthase